MQLYLEGGAWFKKKSPLEKISFLVDWPLSEIKDHKITSGLMARRWCETHETFVYIYMKTWFWEGSGLLTPPDFVFYLYVQQKAYKQTWKIKKTDQFLERLIPPCCSFFSLLAEFPSKTWVLTKPANVAWASNIGLGRLQCLLSFERMERRLWPP